VRKLIQKTRIGERITDIYIALMLLVFPFYIEGDYTTLSGGKYRFFLILCGGYVLVMAGIALWDRLWRDKQTAAELCAVVYLSLTVISALLSKYDGVWLGNGRYEGAVTITVYVLSFLFVSRYGSAKPWQLGMLGFSAGAYAVICLLQIGGWDPLWLYPGNLGYADAGIAYNGAFLGTMGNAGLSGAWLSICVPILFAALFVRKGKRKILLLLPLILSLIAVITMDVTAAVVGAVGGMLLSLPVIVTGKKRKIARVTVGGILALGIVMLWAYPFSGTARELHAMLHGTLSDSFGSGRIGIWRQLWQLLPEYWLFGCGPDAVGFLELVPFVGTVEGEAVTRSIDVAHNEYLQIFICQGIFALAAYLGMLAALGRGWLMGKSKAVIILGCGMLGYCIQAFFSFSMCITAPLFWLALGLLSAESRMVTRKTGMEVSGCCRSKTENSLLQTEK